MKSTYTLLAAAVLGLAGAAVLAAGPPASPAGEQTTNRIAPCVAADATSNSPAATTRGPGTGMGAGRGWCGGRGQGGMGGPGMGRGFGPGGARGMGPRDGSGPRRDGSCLGS